jgi:hypothetical protein
LLAVSRSFMNVTNSVLWMMAIILKAHKVNLFVSSVLFVFWYHSPNFLDTPRRTITEFQHSVRGRHKLSAKHWTSSNKLNVTVWQFAFQFHFVIKLGLTSHECGSVGFS